MLADSKAFNTYAVDDVPRAREFYESTLGLEVTEENGLLMLRHADGHMTMMYPKPDYTPATFTVLSFPVDDLETTVDELAARGVRFARFEGFQQDERGISHAGGPPIAWFTDPAGNILAVLKRS